jgi:NAD(P)-dependent dehydrogenase (short-subunit alcohol dehydrogenase family)
VFITGSADGLGRLAAETLIDDGHQVSPTFAAMRAGTL